MRMSRFAFQKASECWPVGVAWRQEAPLPRVCFHLPGLALPPDLGLCVSEWPPLPVPAPCTC